MGSGFSMFPSSAIVVIERSFTVVVVGGGGGGGNERPVKGLLRLSPILDFPDFGKVRL